MRDIYTIPSFILTSHFVRQSHSWYSLSPTKDSKPPSIMGQKAYRHIIMVSHVSSLFTPRPHSQSFSEPLSGGNSRS